MRSPSPARCEVRLDLRGAIVALAAGLILLVLGLGFDGLAMIVPGIGLLLLGGACATWVTLAARRVRLTRVLATRRVVEGGMLKIRFDLRSGGWHLPGLTVLDRLTAGARLRRGRHEFPAPSITLQDPFGLAQARCRSLDPPTEVLVLPATDPLELTLGGRSNNQTFGRRSGALEPWASGDIDGVRAYRPGTPASRIHWPAVARGVGLLERSYSADRDLLPLIVLDPRRPEGPEGEAALDAAVRAAASLTFAYAREGGCRLLLPDSRVPITVEPDLGSWPTLHARLALVEGQNPGRSSRPARSGALRITALRPSGAPGPERVLYPGPRPVRTAEVVDVAAKERARPVSRARNQERSTLLSFALLAGYGELRWATMVDGVSAARWLGTLALAIAVALAGRRLRRGWETVLALVALVVLLPLSGLPVSWLTHLRVARIVRAIHHGVTTLPSVIVPYIGPDPWTRTVIVLGAGLLMVGAALTIAGLHRRSARIAAALPLIVLAAVPSALARPQFGALHGVILLIALVVFVIGIESHRGALPLLGATALAAVVIAAGVAPARPWVSFVRLAGGFGTGGHSGVTFDWQQTYGPLQWPQTGAEMLSVQASFPAYWKTEDLDTFNGTSWVALGVPGGDDLAAIPAATLRRYTQQLTVNLIGMSTTDVVAAGSASRPLLNNVAEGADSGTWISDQALGPGASYRVSVYTPDPSPGALASAGSDYPAAIRRFTTLPVRPGSVYGPAFALAGQLQQGAHTPYAYALAIARYLRAHYTYNQDPPQPGGYPLLNFLFDSRSGYCQQFAGAMALLLRMGGVPARVAVGFTTGSYSSSGHRWIVSDLDAHAWVEIWFPGFGWVTFDPTPGSVGAPAGPDANASLHGLRGLYSGGGLHPSHPVSRGAGLPARTTAHARGGSSSWLLGALIAVAILLSAGLLALWRRRPASVPQLVAELERAFAVSRRPLAAGVTLGSLASMFEGEAAAGYVRALSARRFSTAERPLGVTGAGRASLRRSLGRGAGLRARLALWFVVPPWRRLD